MLGSKRRTGWSAMVVDVKDAAEEQQRYYFNCCVTLVSSSWAEVKEEEEESFYFPAFRSGPLTHSLADAQGAAATAAAIEDEDGHWISKSYILSFAQ